MSGTVSDMPTRTEMFAAFRDLVLATFNEDRFNRFISTFDDVLRLEAAFHVPATVWDMHAEDIMQHVRLGAMRACKEYDASKGTAAATHLRNWIRWTAMRAIDRGNLNLVRLPSYMTEAVIAYQRFVGTAPLGEDTPDEVIAEATGLPIAKIERARHVVRMRLYAELDSSESYMRSYFVEPNIGDALDNALPNIPEDVIDILRELTPLAGQPKAIMARLGCSKHHAQRLGKLLRAQTA